MSVNLKLIENNFNAKENLTNNKYYTSYDNKKELFTKDNYNEMNQFNFDNDKIKFNSTQMNYHRSNFPIISKNKIETISYSNPIINYDSIHPQNVKIASNLRRKFLEFQRLAKTSYMSKIGNFDKANRTSSNFKNTNNANLRNYDTFKQEKISKNIWDKRFNSSYSIKKVISDTIKEYNTKERQREIKNHLLPKSPIDNLNRPHFNHIPAINKINAEKNTKNANEQIMYKKHLKGRLLKIISDSIVLKKEQLASYRNKKNELPSKTQQEYQIEYRREKNLGILTQKNTDIFPSKDFPITSRYEDLYLTPNELLLKHFTEIELKIIKSDPIYFHLNKGVLKDVTLLKNKTLLETLDEEERHLEHKRRMLVKNLATLDDNVNEQGSNSNRSQLNETGNTVNTRNTNNSKRKSNTRNSKKRKKSRVEIGNEKGSVLINDGYGQKINLRSSRFNNDSSENMVENITAKNYDANNNKNDLNDYLNDITPQKIDSEIKNENVLLDNENKNKSSNENDNFQSSNEFVADATSNKVNNLLILKNKNINNNAHDINLVKNKSEINFPSANNQKNKLQLDQMNQLNKFNSHDSKVSFNSNHTNNYLTIENKFKIEKKLTFNLLPQNQYNNPNDHSNAIPDKSQKDFNHTFHRMSKINKISLEEEAIWTDNYVNKIKENYLSSNKKH